METAVESISPSTSRPTSGGDAVAKHTLASDQPRPHEETLAAHSVTMQHDDVPTDEEEDISLDVGDADHSEPDTSQNMDSSHDKKHPKARRQRTSAEDKAILEAAYQRNKRPGKEEREELMEKTKLSAKGIQIWFQNRRQTDRRKERAWSPTPLSYPGDRGYNFVVVPRPTSSSQPNASSATDGSPVMLNAPINERGESVLATPVLVRKESFNSRGLVPELSAHGPLASDQQAIKSGLEERAYQAGGQIGYLANRRNLSASFQAAEEPSTRPLPSSVTGGRDSPRPETQSFPGGLVRSRSMTNMRLSTSLDGQAKVIPQGPSPQKPEALEPRVHAQDMPVPSTDALFRLDGRRAGNIGRQGLERSQSMGGAVRLPPISDILAPREPPRLGRRRSHIPRNWESVALTKPNDELTAQAEDESQGSALAELSLLRSTSNVQPSKGMTRSKRQASPSRSRGSSSRPTKRNRALDRSASSAAHLEIFDENGSETRADTSEGGKIWGTPKGDSDKENRVKQRGNGSIQSKNDRRASDRGLPNTRRRKANPLQESKSGQLLNARANTSPAVSGLGNKGRDKAAARIGDLEDEENKNRASLASGSFGTEEEAIRSFMRGENVSPSKKDHMEGVACLMHLSRAR